MPDIIYTNWGDLIAGSFQLMWLDLVKLLPVLVAALLVVIIGWLVGAVLGRVVYQIMHSIKIDDLLRKAGLEDWLQRGGVRLDSGHFVGTLVKWFIFVVFLIAAFEILGWTQVNDFLSKVVAYLPQVIIAAIILLAAVIIADVMQKLISSSARAARLKSANFLGSVVKWVIWIFAFLVVLDHLKVATPFVQMLFTGVVIAVSLALGLSFGLGGQSAASGFIEKMREEISDRN